MVLVCLKVLSFNFSTLPIKSFSIMVISLSPWTSMKLFTPSRLSRASDSVNVIFHSSGWVCFVTRFIDWWCNIFQVNDFCNASFTRFLSPIYVLSINSWLWRYSLKVKVYIFINCSFIRNLGKTILGTQCQSLRLQQRHFQWQNHSFLKQYLMVSGTTAFHAVWSQVIAFSTCTPSIIWEAVFPSLILLIM